MAINYMVNGSAETSGDSFTDRFRATGSGSVAARDTSTASHGVASAHLSATGLVAFATTFVREATNVQSLGGQQVWARVRWKGTGLVPTIGLLAYNAGFSSSNNASVVHDVVPPTSWITRVLGPTTMKDPGDIGDVRVIFANAGKTDGSGAFDIYVDEVMFTTVDPTNLEFDGSPRRRHRVFQLRPVSQ